MRRGGLAELLLFFSIFASLWICAHGDLPKRQNTTVAVSSTAEVTTAVVADGSIKQYTIPSALGNSSIRRYCHATCENTYNQLQVDDFLFVFDNFSVNVVSGLRYPRTASQRRVLIDDCDPLTATFEEAPNPFLYLFCRPGTWNNFSATIVGLQAILGPTWLVMEPYTCSPRDALSESDAALFFHSQDGSLYIAFASSRHLGLCRPKTGEPSVFIDLPSDCQWVAKLSQFDAGSIVTECTSGKNSQLVNAVWLFNLRSASFVQKLPHQQYDVGQLVFSADRLIGATWKEATVSLRNLSESNPPSASVTAKGVVDSVHIIGTGLASRLLVVTQRGVEQYGLHAVFDGSTKSTTLGGSENILTQFDDPTCPSTQVIDNGHVMIPTFKDHAYGIAVLSLNGDEPVIVQGVHPARLAFFLGDNTSIPTSPTVDGSGFNAMYAMAMVFGLASIFVIVALVLVLIFWLQRRRKRNRSRTMHPVEEQTAVDGGGDVVVNTSAPQRPHGISLIINRTHPTTDYTRIPPTPDDDSEMITINPVEEEEHDDGQRSWAPPDSNNREDGDGSAIPQ